MIPERWRTPFWTIRPRAGLASLTWRSTRSSISAWRAGGIDWLTGPDRHVFARQIRAAEVDLKAVGAAWGTLSDDWLSDFEASLPMEWNAAAPFVEAAIAHVRAVRDRIEDCLTEIGRILG
jgi:hypothetical protein